MNNIKHIHAPDSYSRGLEKQIAAHAKEVEAAFTEGFRLGKKIQFWDERIKVEDLWLQSDARARGE